MSTAYEIPLSNTPQRFVIGLGATAYEITVRWCAAAAAWVMDVRTEDGTTDVLTGVALVTGADLFRQYHYLGLTGQLRCQTDHDLAAPPTLANLGSEGHVYFIVN